MSVINQMLKDLDKRSPGQEQAIAPSLVPSKKSTLKIVLISALLLLSLNAIGFYVWTVQEKSEFEGLKQETDQNSKDIAQFLTQESKKNNATKIEQQYKSSEMSNNQQLKKTAIPAENTIENVLDNKSQQTINEEVSISPRKLTEEIVLANQNDLSIKPVTELNVAQTKVIQKSIRKKEPLSKMTVSRRQLTPKELISQKLAKAEKFVNLNEIYEAEQLFEEILIIEPTYKQARKQLAALWFGRQSYQQALNLLSQGIALDKQDGELRLMKARIHIKQGQHLNAYKVLKPLNSLEQEEYQVMLANIAQKVEQYPSAIGAYQLLINMQPYSGRWHLGLAIIYDKTSQFPLAVKEYEIALTKADLSASSAKFAQQRMLAIGE